MKELMFKIFTLAQLAFVFGDFQPQNFHYKCSTVHDLACLASELQEYLGTEFENLDPFFYSLQKVDTEEFQFIMKNLTISGLSKSVIDTVSFDEATQTAKVIFHTDLSVRSKYWSNGTLLSKPFFGEGDFALEFDSVLIVMTVPYNITKDAEHGREFIFLDASGFKYYYDVRDGARYDVGNLFYGDKDASDEMHQLMQKNWESLAPLFGGSFMYPMVVKILMDLNSFMLLRP